jgi:bifunctional non-homologous end joining protein LigD
MTLRAYRGKRRFDVTPEPEGAPVDAAAAQATVERGRYVVQRHRATRLHYDVRLEIGGVLVSWAVPRGPTLDPSQPRLAIRVEDHPIEYFGFEGVIPRAQYGAGDVIVWDWGRWTADPSTPDAGAALAAGEFKFRVDGQKLRGGFVLIRTERWQGRRDPKENWLLIHRRDEFAIAGWDAEDHPESVKSGRTNDEVAAGVPAKRRRRAPRRAARTRRDGA